MNVPLDYLVPHLVEAGGDLRNVDILAPSLLSLAAGLFVLGRRCSWLHVCHFRFVSGVCISARRGLSKSSKSSKVPGRPCAMRVPGCALLLSGLIAEGSTGQGSKNNEPHLSYSRDTRSSPHTAAASLLDICYSFSYFLHRESRLLSIHNGAVGIFESAQEVQVSLLG